MPLRLQATEDDVYHLMDLKEQYFIMTAICSVAEGISAYFFIYQKRCWDLVYLCTALALAIILLLRQAIKISRSVMAPMAFSRTERIQDKLVPYLEYCEYRKELDKKTIKAYRIDLRQYFAFICCDEPDKEKIEAYITELHKKYKQKTVKRKIATLKAFYNYLEEEEIISCNPFRKIKVKFKENLTLPRIIPREEIEILLNYMYNCLKEYDLTGYKYKLRDIAVVEVLFATGARVYEISTIREDSVNLNSGQIRIMGKGGKERYVQISNSSVLAILKKYYMENENEIKKSGCFFINNRGKRYTEQSIRAMLKKYAKQAGIERNITPHMFRHSFATYLIEEGVDVSCVQQILGHSSIKTTQIYIHIAAKKQAEILREMHPRNSMSIVDVA